MDHGSGASSNGCNDPQGSEWPHLVGGPGKNPVLKKYESQLGWWQQPNSHGKIKLMLPNHQPDTYRTYYQNFLFIPSRFFLQSDFCYVPPHDGHLRATFLAAGSAMVRIPAVAGFSAFVEPKAHGSGMRAHIARVCGYDQQMRVPKMNRSDNGKAYEIEWFRSTPILGHLKNHQHSVKPGLKPPTKPCSQNIHGTV